MVVERAKELLEAQNGNIENASEAVPKRSERKKPAPLLFDPRELILDSLQDLDLDNLTPMDSLRLLADWQDELDSQAK